MVKRRKSRRKKRGASGTEFIKGRDHAMRKFEEGKIMAENIFNNFKQNHFQQQPHNQDGGRRSPSRRRRKKSGGFPSDEEVKWWRNRGTKDSDIKKWKEEVKGREKDYNNTSKRLTEIMKPGRTSMSSTDINIAHMQFNNAEKMLNQAKKGPKNAYRDELLKKYADWLEKMKSICEPKPGRRLPGCLTPTAQKQQKERLVFLKGQIEKNSFEDWRSPKFAKYGGRKTAKRNRRRRRRRRSTHKRRSRRRRTHRRRRR